MAHRIDPENCVVEQKAQGGLPPMLQLQLGPRCIAQLMVAAKWAEAAARGVQVVYKDTREERFVEYVLQD
jgi:hypothetical protein